MAKNNKIIKQYQNLQERYEEMNDYLLELIDEHLRLKEERRYMNDFIHYKNLDEEFSNFKEQMSNMDKLCKVVKAYSEVLNNVKDAYVNQDLNVINLINNTNSTFKEEN